MLVLGKQGFTMHGFLPSDLRVYTSPFPKKRLGKDYDGGYVISLIPNIHYGILLSGGIEVDISFEEDFIKEYGVKCFAFDGTINRLPKINTDITHIKKNIGGNNNHNLTNLHELIEKNNNIFVKMDIEGEEVDWLTSLNENHMNKFEQLVIEFHFPFSLKEKDIFSKLNKTHVLVHFHGNNSVGLKHYRGVYIPKVFECTYLHKKHFTSAPKLNTQPIPSNIDMPNAPFGRDIHLSYPPFVNA
jgi:hypothetical protein